MFSYPILYLFALACDIPNKDSCFRV